VRHLLTPRLRLDAVVPADLDEHVAPEVGLTAGAMVGTGGCAVRVGTT
jgi:hypothetical protein